MISIMLCFTCFQFLKYMFFHYISSIVEGQKFKFNSTNIRIIKLLNHHSITTNFTLAVLCYLNKSTRAELRLNCNQTFQ